VWRAGGRRRVELAPAELEHQVGAAIAGAE
jgi:hypothetical protein